MRAFSSNFVADVIALTCQDFVVLKGAGRVGGIRSKERDRKSELVLGSTYQIFGTETTRIEILIFGKQIELPQIEFSRKV